MRILSPLFASTQGARLRSRSLSKAHVVLGLPLLLAAPVMGAQQDAPAQEEGAGESAPVAAEAPAPIVIEAARVIVKPGKVIENAKVLIEDGRITAVGADIKVPEGAETMQGEVVCAAFMDPWSIAGIEGRSASSRDLNAAAMAVDAVDPYGQASVLEELVQAGVLLTRSQAGLTAPVGGIGAVLRTSGASVVLGDASMSAAVGAGGGGDARGRNVQFGGPGQFSFGPQAIDPIDRVGQVDKLISELVSGQKYSDDMASYKVKLAEWETAIVEKEKELEDDFKKAKKSRDKKVEDAKEKGEELKEKKYKEDKRPREPKYDAEKAAFARVVRGEMPLVVHAERALEIRDILRLTEPYPRLRLVIAGGTSALAVVDMLKDRGVPVIVAPSPASPGGPVGELDPGLSLAAELDAAGVEVLIGTGGSSSLASRDLPLLAALAVGHGLDRDAALCAITSGPASMFDVSGEVGTVKRGQSADILVLSGDPLSSSSRVLAAISAGSVVYSSAQAGAGK